MEAFGYNQKGFSDEKWIKIGNQMKLSPFVKLKFADYIAEAEHQSKRFYNIAYLTGAIFFVAFLKFPMIRVQPGFRRVGLSAALAYPFYAILYGIGDSIRVKRIKWAYRKNCVDHNAHNKVTI